MKWRHSKEAQAQKDKEKGQLEKNEEDQKMQDETECESEQSESDFDDEGEPKKEALMSEANKSSVITPGPHSTATDILTPSTNISIETNVTPQMLF